MFKKVSLLALLAVLLSMGANAQTLDTYTFSTGVDSTRWVTLSNPSTGITSFGDSYASALLNIGFSFPFSEDTYTQFSINTDGNLRLGSTVTSTSYYTYPFSSTNSNQNNPKINFFGCDGMTVSTAGHYFQYEVVGTAPNRKLVVEFCTGTYSTATRNENYKWQVQLSESGDIDVVYGAAPTTSPAVARQVGMCVNGNEIVLVGSDNTVSYPSVGNSTANWASGTWPVMGRYYHFVRPVVTCPRPSDVTCQAAADELTFAWSETGNSSTWFASLTDGTNSYSQTVYDTTATFSGLTANTPYTFAVRSLCDNGDTSLPRQLSARTLCTAIPHSDLPFFEGFEDYATGSTAAMSPCYYKYYNGTGTTTSYPYPSATTPATGSRCLYYYSSSTAGYYSWMTLPLFDDSLSDLMVTLKLRKSSTTGAGRFQVGVMSDPTDFSTFTVVNDITLENNTTWQEFSTYLSSYQGTGRYIALVAPQTTTTNYIYLDDLTVGPLPNCPAPSAIASLAGPDEVTLSWHENGSASEWEVVLSQGTSVVSTQVVYDTTAYFQGLSAQTDYSVAVRAICGAGDTSVVTGSSFSTPCGAIAHDSLPFFEGFEDYATGSAAAMNPCYYKWNNSAQSATSFPYPSSTTPATGTRALYFYGGTSANYSSYLVLPLFEDSITDLMVSMKLRKSSASYAGRFQVGVMTNPADFSTLTVVNDITLQGNTDWQDFTTFFSAYEGTGRYIALVCPQASTTNYMYLDDVTVDLMPACPGSGNIQLTLADQTATATWTEYGNATSWNLVLVDHDSAVNNSNAYVGLASDTTYTFSGIQNNHMYDLYLSSDCGTDQSDTIMVTFYSFCAPISAADLPYSEDFETYGTGSSSPINPCWTKGTSSTTAYPYPYSTSGINSTRGLYFYGYHPSSATTTPVYSYAALPAIEDGIDVSELSVAFDTKRYSSTTSTYTSLIVLGVMTDPTDISTFDTVAIVDLTAEAANTVTSNFISLASYADTGRYIAFYSPVPALTGSNTYGYNYIHLDNVVVDFTPECEAPDSLMATYVTTDSIQVSWIGTDASAYLLTYDTVSVMVPGITTSYLATGLTPNTPYTFTIRSICSADSSNAVAINVRTACGQIQLPWTENFDSYTNSTTALTGVKVPCWRDSLTGSATYQGTTYESQIYYSTTYTQSAPYCLRFYGKGYHFLPELPCGIDSVMISFSEYTTSASYRLQLVAVEDTGMYVLADVSNTSASTRIPHTLYLNDYPGHSRQLAFYNYYANNTYDYSYIYLDDVTVDYIPSCMPVSSLSCNGATNHTADIVWNGTAGNYEVEYGQSGFQQGNGTSTTSMVDSIQFTGLTANTQYDVYVRQICSAGDTSTWTMATFQTTCDPIATLPWSENFDSITSSTTAATGAHVPCWTYDMLSIGTYAGATYQPQVYYSATYAHSGSYSLRLYGTSITALPPFEADLDTLELNFWSRHTSAPYNLEVGVLEGSNFVPVQTINYSGTTASEQFRVYFSSYTGNSHVIAFRNTYAGNTYNYSYHYIDDISVDYLPSCTPLVNIAASNATQTTFDVDWTDVLPAASYEIEYGQAGFTQGQGTTVIATAHPYTITGLQPSLTYQYYVRPACASNDNDAWQGPFTYNTLCGLISLPYSQNFDYTEATTYSTAGVLPNCWDSYTNGTTATYAPHVVGSSSYWYADSAHSLIMTSGTATYGDTKLVRLPLFDQPVNTLSMSYWLSTESSTSGTFSVGYFVSSNCDTNSFISIKDIAASTATYHGTGSGISANGLRDTVYFDSVPSDAVAIGFRWVYNTSYYSCCIDDVEVVSSNFCQAPATYVTDVTPESARIQWVGNAESYEYSYRSLQDADWSADQLTAADTVVLASLMPSTEYQFRVRALCDTAMISDWAVTSFVTDSLPCTAPEQLSIANVGFTTAQFAWTPVSNENQWAVRVWNTAYDSTFVAQAHPFTATGLNVNTTYSVAVRALCGANATIESATWSDTLTFTTNQCDVPTGVQVTVNDCHSASVVWTPGDNNTGSFVIEYGQQGFASGNGQTVEVNTNSFTLSGLDEFTSYDLYVRAVCEAGAVSTWSSKAQFSTPQCASIADVDNTVLAIYPNPASGSTTISLSGVSGNVRIVVVDMNGRTVRTEQMDCDGSCTKLMNVDNLASGAYFVRLQSENVNMVKKLIVK